MSLVRIKDLNLEVMEEGQNLHPTLIFLHGNPSSIADAQRDVVKRVGQQFHFLSYCRPGFGRSEESSTDLSVENQVELLRNFFSQRHIHNAALIAHSAGCRLALRFAEKYPHKVSALLLFAPYVFVEKDSKSPEGALKLMRLPLIGPVLSILLFQLIGRKALRKNLVDSASPSTLSNEQLTEQLGRVQTLSTFRSILMEKAALIRDQGKPLQLKKITHHVFIFAGSDDAISSYTSQIRPLFQALPNAILETKEGAGHSLSHYSSTDWLRALRQLDIEHKGESEYAAN